MTLGIALMFLLLTGCFDHPEPATALNRVNSVAAEMLRTHRMTNEQFQGVQWCTGKVQQWYRLESINIDLQSERVP